MLHHPFASPLVQHKKRIPMYPASAWASTSAGFGRVAAASSSQKENQIGNYVWNVATWLHSSNIVVIGVIVNIVAIVAIVITHSMVATRMVISSG